MEQKLKSMIKEVLERRDNSFVRELLRGEHHPGKKRQSCENWVQVELAKELAKDKDLKVILEVDNNLDIVLRRGDTKLGIELKIHKDSRSDELRLKKAINNGKIKGIEKGYLVNIKLDNEKQIAVSCDEIT
jgi:hypothetical protein